MNFNTEDIVLENLRLEYDQSFFFDVSSNVLMKYVVDVQDVVCLHLFLLYIDERT